MFKTVFVFVRKNTTILVAWNRHDWHPRRVPSGPRHSVGKSTVYRSKDQIRWCQVREDDDGIAKRNENLSLSGVFSNLHIFADEFCIMRVGTDGRVWFSRVPKTGALLIRIWSAFYAKLVRCQKWLAYHRFFLLYYLQWWNVWLNYSVFRLPLFCCKLF